MRTGQPRKVEPKGRPHTSSEILSHEVVKKPILSYMTEFFFLDGVAAPNFSIWINGSSFKITNIHSKEAY